MAARSIVQIGHPALREAARDVSREELATPAMQALIDDLIDTMRAAHGAGLAANQIGEPVRICAIEVSSNNPRYPYKPPIPLTVLVNPKLTFLTEETFACYEGCLSVPNLRGILKRSVGVHVEAWNRNGEATAFDVWGLSAGTYQHECDHLDGHVFLDRVTDTRTLCTWDEFDRRHKAEFVTRVEALVARFGS